MGALAELITAADPALQQYAVAEPPLGEWEQRLATDRQRAFVMEAVYEAFCLHYGEPRAFRGMDRDLRLLAGDSLYALGLERLAQVGDLEAVAELADLISLSARAQTEGRPELVDVLWRASVESLSERGGPGVRATVGPRFAVRASNSHKS